MEYTIPKGSVEVQTGLWAYLKPFIYNGVDRSHYNIYSGDGYCFWNVKQPENYYEDGTLKPSSERVYARQAYTACKTIEEVNANFISALIENDYKIV